MATILRFIVLDEHKGNGFDELRQSIEKTNKSIGRNESALKSQGKSAKAAQGGLLALTGTLTGLGDAQNVASKKTSYFVKGLAALNLATGVAESSVSALIVTAGALAGSLVSAAAGAGAYEIALKPVLKRVSDLQKAQAAAASGSVAAKKKYQELLKQTPPAIRNFATAVKGAQEAYQNWSFSLAKPVLAPLNAALKLVRPVLRDIKPLVIAAGGAFKTLIDELSAKIEAGGLQRVVSVLLPHVRAGILGFGHVIGNVVAGLWGILKAFIPFSDGVTGGLVKLTARFKEWGSTLSGHSGFQALVEQWKKNWPLVREGLGHLLKILTNILRAMAGMATPSNSRALWQIANPLLTLAEKLSAHPELVTALLYLTLIGKGAGQIGGAFKAMQTGWGSLSRVVGLLSGGKINLGMQTAGDTMLAASRNMQRAADVMAGASAAGGRGAAVGAGAGVAGATARGGVIGWLTRSIGGKWILRGGIAALVTEMLVKPVLQSVPSGKGGNWWDNPGGILRGLNSWREVMKSAGTDLGIVGRGLSVVTGGLSRAGGAAATFSGHMKSLAQPVNDLAGKMGALARAGNPVASAFGKQGVAAKTAGAALNNYTSAIHTNGLRSEQTKIARRTLVNDMITAGVKGTAARKDVAAYTDAIRKNGYGSQQARAARTNLINDIEQAFKNSQRGKADMTRYTDAVRINGAKSDVARNARQKLITDLKSSGLTSKEARRLVDNLTTAIRNIPTHHHTTVSATAFASGKVVAAARRAGRSAQDILAFSSGRQMGWRVPGYGGGDRYPAMLEGGETVVPKHLTPAVAPLMKANRVPGFASGGFVGTGHALQREVPWMDRNVSNFERAEMLRFMRQEIAAAKRRAAAAAVGALGGPTTASARQAIAYARSRMGAYGWGAGQMSSLIPLWMGESGWDRLARNKSSGAYGIPQALPPGKMGAAANPPTSSAAAQINWGLGYIRGRYGSPAGAYSAWLSRSPHWYGGGTPGAAPGWAWVGERGPELVRMRGGETVLPHAASRKIAGYARGTKDTIAEQVHKALRVLRRRPHLPELIHRLQTRLGKLTGRIVDERHLAGHLHGAARRRVERELHRDEHHRRIMRRRLHDATHDRGIVEHAGHSLAARDRRLVDAITAAHRRHMPKVARRLQHQLGGDKGILHRLHRWLSQRTRRLAAAAKREAAAKAAAAKREAAAKAVRANNKVIRAYISLEGGAWSQAAKVAAEAALGMTGVGRWTGPISFDRGGWLMPGATLAVNRTGRPEPVGAAAHVTYNITINVPPGANKAAIGREFVQYIKEYERSSGNSWRR